MFVFSPHAPHFQQFIYYIVVFITLIILVNKYKSDSLKLLIIFIFYPAIFSFLGKGFQDIYKIVILTFVLIYSYKNNVFKQKLRGD